MKRYQVTKVIKDTFSKDTWFGVGDLERYSAQTPDEAVHDWLELLEYGDEITAPLEVNVYSPKEIDPRWIQTATDVFLEQWEERWAEEFGDWDEDNSGRDGSNWAEMHDLLASWAKRSTVFSCEQVAIVEYPLQVVGRMYDEMNNT